ncbi:MAG: gliding motility-associated C-terminal domain-containing protein [Cyclobacteriaceae bacterium]|nr:gliding motility-associated C-terminal domain-containing protein [Cyclobacteriaceae bacterium]
MQKLLKSLFFGIILFFLASSSMATHIRAGEITVQRVNCQSKTFIIYITGYVDLSGGQVTFGAGMLDFGDGSAPIENIRTDSRVEIILDEVDIGNDIKITRFKVEHTYSGNGIYFINYQEFNRNAGIVNMDNSVETPFYIETMVRIDGTLGCNMFLPEMLVPPIDFGCTGVAFYHNPGAFDRDGDSLAFEFVTPRKARNTPVDNYRVMNDPEFGGFEEGTTNVPAGLTINPLTGDLVWNSPGLQGEYNVAFIVKEYRRLQGEYFLIGSVVRDMQILVDDCDNNRPRLTLPNDICVEAGDNVNFNVFATDEDGDDVKIEVFSVVLYFPESPATYSPDPAVFQPQPGTLNFDWNTTCDQVREQPYLVTFKVTDQPDQGRPLVEFGTVNIIVVAPAPENLQSTVNADRTIDLTWDDYSCNNAEKIQIWRRVDTYPLTPDECDTGMPDYAGYTLIDEVPALDTSYKDDNNGNKLAFDANYCYRLVAVFPSPQNGESYVSTETCGIIKADGPAITHVTVDKTDLNDGEITVSWRGPFEIDQVLFPPPYSYELWRGAGFEGDIGVKIMDISSDTTFVDSGLNTAESPYHYTVKLFDNNNTEIRSMPASSVYNEPTALTGAIELNWSAHVPWSNNTFTYPYHYIYRDRVDASDPEKLVLIDSVDVNQNGFFYHDNGSFNGEELSDQLLYCYYIQVFGTYGNPNIDAPQINLSQIICAQPNDTITPCPPELFLTTKPCNEIFIDRGCGFVDYYNTIVWNKSIAVEEEDCDLDDEIKGYNIYFSATGAEDTFEKIDLVKDTTYFDGILNSFAGCYYVTAVDRSNNESIPSNTVCNDNCPYYELPNVITPNDDGKNDTFRPFDESIGGENGGCPRFVNSVKFMVFNRWGEPIYTYESGGENSVLINWDGTDNAGKLLSSGVYFYSAEVEFELRRAQDRSQRLNGWVHVLY